LIFFFRLRIVGKLETYHDKEAKVLCILPVDNRVKRFIKHAGKRYKLTQLFMII